MSPSGPQRHTYFQAGTSKICFFPFLASRNEVNLFGKPQLEEMSFNNSVEAIKSKTKWIWKLSTGHRCLVTVLLGNKDQNNSITSILVLGWITLSSSSMREVSWVVFVLAPTFSHRKMFKTLNPKHRQQLKPVQGLLFLLYPGDQAKTKRFCCGFWWLGREEDLGCRSQHDRPFLPPQIWPITELKQRGKCKTLCLPSQNEPC